MPELCACFLLKWGALQPGIAKIAIWWQGHEKLPLPVQVNGEIGQGAWLLLWPMKLLCVVGHQPARGWGFTSGTVYSGMVPW